ncbi:MAG: T9SS type A sorting domain-containing protein [Bacteroidetes bacterium]|nr:T9SS type A sorting domain-containing protein [Bacteroidota bacterium]
MYKTLLITLAIPLLLTSTSNSQIIINYNMEDWDTLVSPNNTTYYEPTNWSASSAWTLSIGSGPGVTQVNPGISGKASATVSTVKVGFTGAPHTGYLGYGEIPFNNLGFPQTIKGGMPVVGKPVLLKGWYIFNNSFEPTDRPEVHVILKKYNNSQYDTVAYGFITLPIIANPTPFQVSIIDQQTGLVADSLVIAFTSTSSTNPLEGGTLIIDSLELVYAADTTDAGISFITTPGDTVQVNDPHTVSAWINNYYSTDVQAFNVGFSANGVEIAVEPYSSLLPAGDSILFTFTGQWQPTEIKNYEVCVYTSSVINDIDITNDTTCRMIYADGIVDVGPTAILSPPSIVSIGAAQSVSAVVENFGDVDITSFNVNYSVNGNTAGTITVMDTIPPGAADTINFTTAWTPGQSGNQDFCVFTSNLTGDADQSNDTLCSVIDVTGYTDGGVTAIQSPIGTIIGSNPINVNIRIKNFGDEDIDTFEVAYTVNGFQQFSEIHTNTITPGDSVVFTFSQQLIPPSEGSFDLCAYCHSLVGDSFPSNDTSCAAISIVISIAEINAETGFEIYPNPANEIALIVLNEYTEELVVINSIGQEVTRLTSLDKGTINLDLKEYSSGTYVISIRSREGKTSAILIVE